MGYFESARETRDTNSWVVMFDMPMLMQNGLTQLSNQPSLQVKLELMELVAMTTKTMTLVYSNWLIGTISSYYSPSLPI